MDRYKGLQIPATGKIEQAPRNSLTSPLSDDAAINSEQSKAENKQDSELSISESRYLSSPFLSKAICEPEIQRQSLSDHIDRQFQDYGSAHGAIDSRVLLWGREGDG